MTSKTSGRTSLYVRLSKTGSAESLSLAGQAADLRALCAREGLTEVALHTDDGLSGALRDRPEFLAWLADAKEGRADVLVAWSVDRMTREGLGAAAVILDVHETTGARLLDTQGLDSNGSDAWRLVFVIKAEMARAELQRIGERNRAADLRLREAGRFAGGRPPYGYRVIPNPAGPGKVLDLESAEAATIRLAAEWVLAGVPLGTVARRLNSTPGHTPRRAAHWSRNALRQVLTGDAILGRVSFPDRRPVTPTEEQEAIDRAAAGLPPKPVVRQSLLLRDADGAIRAPFPAVLDLTTALAVRGALGVRKETKPRTSRYRLATGLLECSSCGGTLRVAQVGTGKAVRLVFRCSARSNGLTCDRPVAVSAEPLEAALTAHLLDAVGRLPRVVRRTTPADTVAVETAAEAVAAAGAAVTQDPTPEAFARLQAAHAALATAKAAPSAPASVEYLPTGETVAEAWAAGDLFDRRELLAYFLATPVRVLPGKPGRHGLDPARLDYLTRLDVPHVDAADL